MLLAKNGFKEQLKASGVILEKGEIEVLQVNVGKYCNLACAHCHVGAGPGMKKENMTKETAKALVSLMDFKSIISVDITGGAPELNPSFRYLVLEAKKRNLHVINRSNLTVLFDKGQENLAEFLSENRVEIVVSLPCYSRDNVDKQRGKGVFYLSIKGLKLLNQIGYGREEALKLNLVFNPIGMSLPPLQKKLEKEYKEKLFKDFGIIFNSLYTMTNMPIGRYKIFLKSINRYEEYKDLLAHNFNAQVLDNLMCRNTLSVGWDGKLFDCDFNQVLGMQISSGKPLTIFNVNVNKLKKSKVLSGVHCYGCTTGSGSSCQGKLEDL